MRFVLALRYQEEPRNMESYPQWSLHGLWIQQNINPKARPWNFQEVRSLTDELEQAYEKTYIRGPTDPSHLLLDQEEFLKTEYLKHGVRLVGDNSGPYEYFKLALTLYRIHVNQVDSIRPSYFHQLYTFYYENDELMESGLTGTDGTPFNTND